MEFIWFEKDSRGARAIIGKVPDPPFTNLASTTSGDRLQEEEDYKSQTAASTGAATLSVF